MAGLGTSPSHDEPTSTDPLMKSALSFLLVTVTLGASIAAHAGPNWQVIDAARAHARQAAAAHCAASHAIATHNR